MGTRRTSPRSPSSEHGPGWWPSLESEARASLAGGDKELSVHLAASVGKLPRGVVPPDDSPARDLSSSLWASSMSWESSKGMADLGPVRQGPGGGARLPLPRWAQGWLCAPGRLWGETRPEGMPPSWGDGSWDKGLKAPTPPPRPPTLSLLSLTVSCSMVRKMLPTSLRARLGGERLGRRRPPLPPRSCQGGRPSGWEGSVLESGGPAGMLT